MTDIQMTILGVSLIGIATMAGSAMVYFFKNTFSEKFTQNILGLCRRRHDCRQCLVH
jgi:hypothetical protein